MTSRAISLPKTGAIYSRIKANSFEKSPPRRHAQLNSLSREPQRITGEKIHQFIHTKWTCYCSEERTFPPYHAPLKDSLTLKMLDKKEKKKESTVQALFRIVVPPLWPALAQCRHQPFMCTIFSLFPFASLSLSALL